MRVVPHPHILAEISGRPRSSNRERNSRRTRGTSRAKRIPTITSSALQISIPDLSCITWPRLEVTHRFKSDGGLGALIRLALGRDLRVDIVQEVGSHIEGTVATVLPGGHLLPLVQPRLVADYLLQTTRP